jgi:hypothetical protein
MRTLVISLFILCTVIFSCKKNDVTKSISTASLTGTWKLVSDSSSIAGGGPIKGGGQTYLGTPADHYTFTTNGMMYANDGAEVDTAAYTLGRDSVLQLNYSYRRVGDVTIQGSVASFKVTTLQPHAAVLTDRGLTPEGWYARIITLKR